MVEASFTAPSWGEIDEMVWRIVEEVERRGFKPDLILGVSRGGIIPALLVSDRLGVPLDIIGVRFYKGVGDVEERPHIIQDISRELGDKRVLIIDDVSDTGHTLRLVKNYVEERGAREVMVCTLHYKPWAVYRPDYYVEETEAWIIYPWEVKETIDYVSKRLREKGLSWREVREEMRRRGIPEEMLEMIRGD
jgi:hypothetical protein